MQNFEHVFRSHNFANAERQSCDHNWPQIPLINTGRQQNIKI